MSWLTSDVPRISINEALKVSPVKDLLMEVGVDKTVHGFRHYFTTTLIAAYQSDLLRVANYTRHRSMETLQVYSDRLDDEADPAKLYSSFTATVS